MGQSPQSTTADSILNELHDQAAEHKKIERRSRALAQRTYATIREVEAFCDANGIPYKREPRKERR